MPRQLLICFLSPKIKNCHAFHFFMFLKSQSIVFIFSSTFFTYLPKICKKERKSILYLLPHILPFPFSCCISYTLLHNKSSPKLNTTLFHSFCRLEIWMQVSWILFQDLSQSCKQGVGQGFPLKVQTGKELLLSSFIWWLAGFSPGEFLD
jgi:hypothetical protein